MPPTDNQLLLPGGRTISYAIIGDPAAPPAFYFHGWPASRLEAAVVDDVKLRLIAIDRPGYGYSSAQARRRLVDWPADVTALADHLGLERFYVVGVSGGAPYAVACAHTLDRVAGTALISPLPPLAPGAAPADAVLGRGLRRLQWLGQHPRAAYALMASIRQGVRVGLFDPHRVLEGASTPADVACLTPARRAGLIGAWAEGLRQGVAGAASDARIYASDWGFDLASMRAPVGIWHGTADIVVPHATLSAYAALPAKVRLVEGEGHYSLALTRSAEILDVLIKSK